jgi:hypothetical protein
VRGLGWNGTKAGFVWICLPLRFPHTLIFDEFDRIFGPERDVIIGGWRKLYNEEVRQI